MIAVRGRTLTRGGRVYGTVSCVTLASLSLGWILRDLYHSVHAADLWWMWSGLPARSSDGLWTASFYEPVLLGVYLMVACTLPRAPDAAGTLGSAGALTLALRLPSLWNLRSDWLQGIDDTLRTRALLSTALTVAISATMLIVAVAARRPAPCDGGLTRPPEPLGAVVLLLASVIGVTVAWQVELARQLGWDGYRQQLTGEHSLLTLLSPPPVGAIWAVSLLAVGAALAALRRRPFARPLAMMVAATVLAWGLTAVTSTVRTGVLRHLDAFSTVDWLRLFSDLFLVAAGLAVLLVSAHGALRATAAHPAPGHREVRHAPPG